MRDYNRALQLNPKYTDCYINRGLIYKQAQHWLSALADYNQAIRLEPQYGLGYMTRGSLYLQRQQYALAVQDLQLSRKYHGPDHMILKHLRQARRALGIRTAPK